MSAIESASLAALSDSDAVSLLFDLTGHGDGDKLLQLDAVVYTRLARAYAEQPPAPATQHA
ncbi:MAG TPA: hypothetical protein VIK70_09750 [Lysobacter sp.]